MQWLMGKEDRDEDMDDEGERGNTRGGIRFRAKSIGFAETNTSV